MKVKVYEEYGDEKITELALYIYYKIDGEDYERGQIETIEASIDNIIKTIAKLIELLISNKILSLDDVPNLVNEYNSLDKLEEIHQ